MVQSFNEISLGKKVIIIGNLSLEGVTDKIVALGHTYKVRNPFSLPENWIEIQKNIHQLKENGELLAVIMYLTPGVIRHSREPKYQEAWRYLLMEIKSIPSLIFAPEALLSGNAFYSEPRIPKEDLTEEEEYRAIEMTKQLLQMLQESSVEVIPYERNSEVTLQIQRFLDDVDKGVFLQLYVPNGRYQAEQLESYNGPRNLDTERG